MADDNTKPPGYVEPGSFIRKLNLLRTIEYEPSQMFAKDSTVFEYDSKENEMEVKEHFGMTFILCYFPACYYLNQDFSVFRSHGYVMDSLVSKSAVNILDLLRRVVGEINNQGIKPSAPIDIITASAGYPKEGSGGMWVWQGEPTYGPSMSAPDFSDGEWRRPYLIELEDMRQGKGPFRLAGDLITAITESSSSHWSQGHHRYGITPQGKIINPLAPKHGACNKRHYPEEHCSASDNIQREHREKMQKKAHQFIGYSLDPQAKCLECGNYRMSEIHSVYGTGLINPHTVHAMKEYGVTQEMLGMKSETSEDPAGKTARHPFVNSAWRNGPMTCVECGQHKSAPIHRPYPLREPNKKGE